MALRRSEGFCRYVLSVQYHGSRFLGFTYQGKQGEDCILPNGTDLRGVRSVEGRLRQALDDLVGEGNYENIQVSSRTDRGVHGVKNTCHVDVRSRRLAAAENWDSKNLMGGLNSYLVNQGNMVPPTDLLRFQHRKRKRRGYQQNLLSGMQDVRVLNALPAPDTMSNTFYGQPPIIDWNARFSATERTYVYRILHTQDRNYGIPFEWDRSWRLAGLADDGLDIAAMNNAAQILTGTHDFSSFRGSLCQRSSPIVPISQISVHSQPHSLPGDEIVCGGLVGPEVGSKEKNHASLVAVKIVGESFVYRQVRNLVACLVDVGRGRLSPEEVERILQECDRSKNPSGMAPAHGLFLVDVKHGDFEI